jgi:hypothetical protein
MLMLTDGATSFPVVFRARRAGKARQANSSLLR